MEWHPAVFRRPGREAKVPVSVAECTQQRPAWRHRVHLAGGRVHRFRRAAHRPGPPPGHQRGRQRTAASRRSPAMRAHAQRTAADVEAESPAALSGHPGYDRPRAGRGHRRIRARLTGSQPDSPSSARTVPAGQRDGLTHDPTARDGQPVAPGAGPGRDRRRGRVRGGALLRRVFIVVMGAVIAAVRWAASPRRLRPAELPRGGW